MVREIRCFRRHPAILVTADPENEGALCADCGTHVLNNIDPNDLRPITKAYIGYEGPINIHVKANPDMSVYELPEDDERRIAADQRDDEICDKLHLLFDFEHNWQMYHKPFHDAYTNIYDNWRELSEAGDDFATVEDLKGWLEGKTLVFVGGGPSAKKYKSTIQRLVNHPDYCVIGAGSGLRLLCQWGIRPNLAYSFDPFPAQYEAVFKDLTRDFIEGLPLFTNAGLNHAGFCKWMGEGGRLILNGGMQSLEMISKIDELPGIRDGHVGVSTGFLELASHVGCKEVLFVGLDLAFKGTRQYADNLEHESYKNGIETVTEPSGATYTTRHTWAMERDWLQRQLDWYGIKAYRLSSKHCLPIKGVEDVHTWSASQSTTEAKDLTYSVINRRFFDVVSSNAGRYVKAFRDLDTSSLDPSNIAYQHGVAPLVYVHEGQLLRGGVQRPWIIDMAIEQHIDGLDRVLRSTEYFSGVSSSC